MEVFTCWIGEQEKEIRNIKTKTTVQGMYDFEALDPRL